MTDTLLKMEYLLLPEMVKEAIKSLKPFHEKVSSALEDNSVVWFDADNPGLLTTDCLSTVENMQKKGFEIGHRETKLPENKRWIFVKRAAEPLKAKDTLSTIPKLMNLAPNSFNQNFGEFGTSPLFSMLTSGALGGGAGYLTGSLLERLFPERFVKRDRLNKTLGVIGALGGAAIPAYLGVVGMRNWDDKDKSKWNAWVKPNVFWGSQPEEKPQEKISEAINRAFEGIKDIHPNKESEQMLDDYMQKQSLSQSGIENLPTIPVDAFNRSVMMDPFASIPLRTATVGLTEAANQSKGNMGIISPFDISRVGLGMGAGLSQAYIGGKVLGALAGLTPTAQRTLQNTGMFAGALKAVIPGLFGQ
jgi:hypothetical protein